MPSVFESAATQLGSTIRAGNETISGDQQITFNLYVKLVLPVDGYVFWVRAANVSENALISAGALNAVAIDPPPIVDTTGSPYQVPRFTFQAAGSLHYQTTAQQTEDANYSINQIVFSSEIAINDLNAVSPNLLYIGTWQNEQFAFSERRMFYQQAGIYHYGGVAVTAVMQQQILETPWAFDVENVVISNSLPLWLSMNPAAPPLPFPPSSVLPLYPSRLVPQNATPPYGVIDVKNTKALQPTPVIDCQNNTWQLLEDEVDVTIYGNRSNAAIDFRDYVYNISTWFNVFGVMNYPVIQDQKLGSKELQTIAMMKKITFNINYYLYRIRNIAQQQIQKVLVNYIRLDQPQAAGTLAEINGPTFTTSDGYYLAYTENIVFDTLLVNNPEPLLADQTGAILQNNGALLARAP